MDLSAVTSPGRDQIVTALVVCDGRVLLCLAGSVSGPDSSRSRALLGRGAPAADPSPTMVQLSAGTVSACSRRASRHLAAPARRPLRPVVRRARRSARPRYRGLPERASGCAPPRGVHLAKAARPLEAACAKAAAAGDPLRRQGSPAGTDLARQRLRDGGPRRPAARPCSPGTRRRGNVVPLRRLAPGAYAPHAPRRRRPCPRPALPPRRGCYHHDQHALAPT